MGLPDLSKIWRLAAPTTAIPILALKKGIFGGDDDEESGPNIVDDPVSAIINKRLAAADPTALINKRLADADPSTRIQRILLKAGLASPEAEQADPQTGLAQSIARLSSSNPEAAQHMLTAYGADIDPETLRKAGISPPDDGDGPGGVLGTLQRTGSSLLGQTLEVLSAPGQAVKGTIHGGPMEGLRALGGKYQEHLLAPESGGGVLGFAARLGEDIVTDPLSYMTSGTSAVAKSALRGVAGVAGKGLAEDLAKVGVKGALKSGSLESREALSTILEQAATNAGSRNAAGAAAKQLIALEKGGRGGLKLGLPFADGHTVLAGDKLGRLKGVTEFHPVQDAVGSAISAVALPLRKAFVPRAVEADALGKVTARMLGQAETVGHVGAARASEEWHEALRVKIEGTGVKFGELRDGVRRSLDGEVDVPLSAEGAKAKAAYEEALGTLEESAAGRGLIRPDQMRSGTYVPIIESAEGKALRLANGDVFDAKRAQLMPDAGAAAVAQKQGGHLQHRTFDTIAQEQAFYEGLPGAKRGVDYVIHDPFVALDIRAAHYEQAAAVQTMVDEMQRMPEFRGLVDELPGAEAAPGRHTDALSALKGREATANKGLSVLDGKLSGLGPVREVGQSGKLVRDPVARLGLEQQRVALGDTLTDVADRSRELRSIDDELQAAHGAGQAVPEGKVLFPVNEAGRQVAMDPHIAAYMTKVRDVVTNDETLSRFAAGAQAVNTYWKSVATVMPIKGTAFPMRNMQGNFSLLWLHGVQNPKHIVAGMRQRLAVEHPALRKVLGDVSEEDVARLELAKQKGVLGSSFEDVDMKKVLPDLRGAGAPKGNPVRHHFQGKGKGVQTMRSFNSAIEDSGKLAAFNHALEKGMNPDDAAMFATDALFDYRALTPFERSLKNKFFPFYTFMRKNLSAQMWGMIHQPGRQSALAHAYSALAGNGEDGGPLPQYAVNNGQMPLGGALAGILGGGGNPVMAGIDMPLGSATETADPLLKAGLLAGSFIPGLGQLRKDGDVKDLGRGILNAPGGPGIDVLRSFTEATTGTSLLTGSKIPAGAEENKFNEAVFPLLGAARRGAEKAGIGSVAKALGSTKSDEQIGRRQIASLLFGVNTMPLEASAQRSENYRRLSEVDALIARLRGKGINTPTLSDLRKAGKVPASSR